MRPAPPRLDCARRFARQYRPIAGCRPGNTHGGRPPDGLQSFSQLRSEGFQRNRRQGSRRRLSLLSGRQINLTSKGAPELCVQARLYPFQVCPCRRATGRFLSPEHPHRVRKPLRPARTGAALTMRRCRAARALWPLRWLSGCPWAARSRA